jgi:excinuclease ABC subunit C
VGSLVWFESGRPKKSEYRRYKIKGEGNDGVEPGVQQDDFAAIREVVSRFVARRVAEDKPLPDLVVVDGGKGQLGAARQALADASRSDLPLASLAKREEEVFLPDRPESVRLSKRAPSLRLLQRARDEAHRFAVEYNRRRRSKRTITSELLNIPGIGPQRRRALLERFGSLAGVRLATADEIAAVPGFSRRLAQRLLDHLRT